MEILESGAPVLWVNELLNLPEFGIRKGIDNSRAKKQVERIAKLIPDLIKEELDADKATVMKENARALAKVKHEKAVHAIKMKLMTEFSDRIDMEQKGTKVEIPNAIMLIDEHDDLSKELVVWTGKNSDCNFVQIPDADNKTLLKGLSKALKESKENFLSTKRRTLIDVEGFHRLITEGENTLRNIASLKDIMSRCSKDFGSTIIFRTKNISNLVKEAIQPHRVAAKILVAIRSFK